MIKETLLFAVLDSISLPHRARLYIAENFDCKALFDAPEKYKAEIVEALGEAVFIKLCAALRTENVERVISELEKYKISVISCKDKEFPQSLKNLADYPTAIYYKGDISLLKENLVAIIGTRRPTFYGRDVTALFAKELARAGVVTVSGLAYGLDSVANEASIKAGGKTVAVLGGSVDEIYPRENENLAASILKNGGLILSEYYVGRRAARYTFLERNRIISGISLGVIVAEAGKRSGTLNTINHAIDQGKEVFVIPGNIFSKASEGTNELILELPEVFTISPAQVLKKLNIKAKSSEDEKKKTEILEDEKKILNALYEGEMDVDTLSYKTSISSKSLISLLTRMEISGLIKKLPGNFYSL